MTFGLFPVYCQTPAARCIETDLLIDYKPLNTKARCPICGRFSVAERGGDNDQVQRKDFSAGAVR